MKREPGRPAQNKFPAFRPRKLGVHVQLPHTTRRGTQVPENAGLICPLSKMALLAVHGYDRNPTTAEGKGLQQRKRVGRRLYNSSDEVFSEKSHF